MFRWLNKTVSCLGSALFRGSPAPHASEFGYLTQRGIEVAELDPEGSHWTLGLRHPHWGEAQLASLRDLDPPPTHLAAMDLLLTQDEREEIAQAGSVLTLRLTRPAGQVLRDRKHLLRFLDAVLGEHGLAAMDHLASRFWSREALDLELMHDADLDIDGILALHAVTGDDSQQVQWLHSHGLAKVGAFDFDILEPAPELSTTAYDGIRAIAFAILEGELSRSAPRFHLASPRGSVRTVSAAEFDHRAAPRYRTLRDDPHGDHRDDRVVLCEPVGRLLGKWLGSVEPSRFLSHGFREEGMFHFSHAASALMADRARNTYALFLEAFEELAGLDLPALAKMGYRVDGGGPQELEHLWFQVHGTTESEIDAQLINEPFHIARMQLGQRARHPVDLLSDWQILTPAGPINSRQTMALRYVRRHRDELSEILRGGGES